MNDNVKKWVAALRSGEYKQGRLYLLADDQHCCLGVACEVAILNGAKIKRMSEHVCDDSEHMGQCAMNVVSFDGETRKLPPEVKAWLGVNCPGGSFSGTGSLSKMNDNGYSFNQIADFIESHEKELFTNVQY